MKVAYLLGLTIWLGVSLLAPKTFAKSPWSKFAFSEQLQTLAVMNTETDIDLYHVQTQKKTKTISNFFRINAYKRIEVPCFQNPNEPCELTVYPRSKLTGLSFSKDGKKLFYFTAIGGGWGNKLWLELESHIRKRGREMWLAHEQNLETGESKTYLLPGQFLQNSDLEDPIHWAPHEYEIQRRANRANKNRALFGNSLSQMFYVGGNRYFLAGCTGSCMMGGSMIELAILNYKRTRLTGPRDTAEWQGRYYPGELSLGGGVLAAWYDGDSFSRRPVFFLSSSGRIQNVIEEMAEFNQLVVSPNGKSMLTTRKRKGQIIEVWNLNGKKIADLLAPDLKFLDHSETEAGVITGATYSNKGNLVLISDNSKGLMSIFSGKTGESILEINFERGN